MRNRCKNWYPLADLSLPIVQVISDQWLSQRAISEFRDLLLATIETFAIIPATNFRGDISCQRRRSLE